MIVGGNYTIDFAKVSNIPKFAVGVKVGDSKRKISLTLLENNMPINLNYYNVVVACKKSDGNDIFNTVIKTDAINGKCEIEITNQMLVLDTDLPCEIVLYGTNGVVATSSNFVIGRISSVRDEKSVVSSSEFTALTNALSQVARFDSRITEIENKGTTIEVLERVTKEEIDRQIADGTIANLTLKDDSITGVKIKDGEITSKKIADYSIKSNHISDDLFMGGEYIKFDYIPKSTATESYLMLGIENLFPGEGVSVSIEFDVTHSESQVVRFGNGGLNSIDNPNYNSFNNWAIHNSVNCLKDTKISAEYKFTCSSNEDYPHIVVGLAVSQSDLNQKELKVENIKVTLTYEGESVESKVVCAGFHYQESRYNFANVDMRLEQDIRFIQGVENIVKRTPFNDNSIKFEYLSKDVPMKISEALFGENEDEVFYKPNIDEFEERVSSTSTTFIIAKPIPSKCFISSIKFDTTSDVKFILFTKTDDNYFTPYAIYNIPMVEAIEGTYSGIEIAEENTYIGLHGFVAYQSNIDSNLNINKMYDFKTTPVVGEQASAILSGIRVWFDMEIMTNNSPNPLLGVENEIKSLNKQIEDLKYIISNMGGGNTLSDNPVNNLKNVWDLNLNMQNDSWVYSNAKIDENNGILCEGASKAYYNQYLTFDTYQQKTVVTVKDVNSQFGLMCHNGNKGALYLVDGVNKRISLHSQYTGGGIPTLKTSTPLPFELKADNNYMLSVVKTGWKHTFTITDLKTMEECVVEFDNATQSSSGSYCGKGWGGPGVVTFAGSVIFKNHKYYVALYPKAKALFIGDSITEGTNMGANVDIKYRWCSLLRDNYFNYDAIICGRGGATSNDILSRMNSLEALNVKSDIVIVLDGTNERSQSAVDNWKVKMPQIREKIISWGAKPIICVPPIPSSGFEYIAQMRDFILEQGWDTIRMDIATSLNGDGVTYDSSLYTDGVHPNKKGGEQMYNRAIKDLDIIL